MLQIYKATIFKYWIRDSTGLLSLGELLAFCLRTLSKLKHSKVQDAQRDNSSLHWAEMEEKCAQKLQKFSKGLPQEFHEFPKFIQELSFVCAGQDCWLAVNSPWVCKLNGESRGDTGLTYWIIIIQSEPTSLNTQSIQSQEDLPQEWSHFSSSAHLSKS